MLDKLIWWELNNDEKRITHVLLLTKSDTLVTFSAQAAQADRREQLFEADCEDAIVEAFVFVQDKGSATESLSAVTTKAHV